MSGHRWHLAHADGRPWTSDELDAIVQRELRREGEGPNDERCWFACISEDADGLFFLLDSRGAWHAVEDDDMRAVWDG